MNSQLSSNLPMAGVRVLDLSRMLAAPFSSQMMGDLGAEVIKVERPRVGDDMRGYGPPYIKARDGSNDDSPYFICANRNKKSVAIDLADPQGADLVRELAKISDVMIENYKVGDLRRYGLDYESIRLINPRIVYCSVTGFGQTGPDAQRPGLDTLFQATSGLMSMTGEPDGPPTKVGVPISDFIGGLYASIGILAALRHAEQTGQGQHIDLSLLECTLAALGNRGQAYLATGGIPKRRGSSTPANEPAGVYSCAGGQQVVLSAGSDNQFKVLARILGREDWITDPRYYTRSERNVHREALNAELEEVLGRRSRNEWIALFKDAKVMCAAINDAKEAFEEPQVLAREVIVEAVHPRAGPVPMVRNPLRFSQTPIPTPKISPDLGQHTVEVLGELLGKTAEQIELLRSRGII